ncbi:amino acid/amide ABC transporter ATP-binding protein 2, HAAT family [Jatrophihabitans endophyticus]|uniref:Amino acid/amide ABC transporter ATP-binding protein 2, HAAT family n=1 Tax=Jatrophihabitans endophyticus TaxID=1206085 RepID=A0A1M5PZS7_9ACTN|nr:ABC transporter ATP-binding protein [Jatrophihabitans endophyticus]SHH07375.1 amino acid/amide ABC transporter ATP-binding protein 2, HAAT family [Jatrophihabitans endophyticus]
MAEGLRIEGLTAGYAGIAAVRDVSLTVAPGEVVALLGPNGAGKSTTLLSAIGALAPMGGRVLFDGQDITGRTPDAVSRLGLALVPDSRGIFFDLTVRDHFRLAAPKGDKAAVEAMLDRFGALRGLMDRRAGLLSGGEQQMLALAKAFVTKPSVLMVDEMSLGLAPLIVQSLMPIMRRAAEEEGMGILLVEQHIEMALKVADRGIVLNRGAVRFEGPARELLTNRADVEASYMARA